MSTTTLAKALVDAAIPRGGPFDEGPDVGEAHAMNGRTPKGVRSGKVRSARLTDLAALGDLSRLSQGDMDDGSVQSLGLPLAGSSVSVFSLFRMPLGAFQPHDQLYVFEEDRHLAGLLRVERDSHRDEWTIVELDAIGQGEAGDIRFRLVQHLLRDGSKRGATRFHVACADTGGNVELFMQHGFARYGEEWLFFRPLESDLPAPLAPEEAAELGIRPTQPLDALRLSQLYAAATPAPVARLEGYRLPDWERQGSQWRIPRSSLTPILRFADVSAFVQEAGGAIAGSDTSASRKAPGGTRAGGKRSGSGGSSGQDVPLGAFVQLGVSKEAQPHYLRIIARPDFDTTELIRFGLGHIAEQAAAHRLGGRDHGHDHGVVSAVRTYEAPVDTRLEDAGFDRSATVTLLMKETLVRVAEPALVPAVR